MRSVSLFLVVFIALVSFASTALAVESCPEENCVSPEQCDTPWRGTKCEGTEKICCSVLKPGHLTHCRHYGGECMRWCNEQLRRNVTDTCPEGEMCCVLV